MPLPPRCLGSLTVFFAGLTLLHMWLWRCEDSFNLHQDNSSIFYSIVPTGHPLSYTIYGAGVLYTYFRRHGSLIGNLIMMLWFKRDFFSPEPLRILMFDITFSLSLTSYFPSRHTLGYSRIYPHTPHGRH